MSTTICRPFITLRNGKILYAWEKGLKAFCFEVDEVKQKASKDKSEDASENSVSDA